MIFVLDHDDKGLQIFNSREEAIAACEGIDVEENPCEFWDGAGLPLKVVFTKPNERGSFSVVSGVYHLEPNENGEPLINMLSAVSYIEGNDSLSNIEQVRQLLTRRSM